MIKGFLSLLRERRNWESTLFYFLSAISALPIWRLSQVPTQDGPAHLYNAYLLSGWWKASFPVDRTIFALNPAPVPNWFSTVALAIFMTAFSPLVAEKLLLTLYVVLLPAAFRYASRSFSKTAPYVYFLGFPIVWNYFFELGFFNFCISVVWYLFLLGYWARNRNSPAQWQVATLFLLSLLLYFSNGLSYYLAAASMGLLTLSAQAFGGYKSSKARWLTIFAPHAFLLVALPLSVLYFSRHGKYYATQSGQLTLHSLSWTVTRMSILVPSFNAVDLKLSALFGLVLLIGVLATCYSRRNHGRKIEFSDGLLIATAAQFVLYVIAPQHIGGGGFINYRILLFAVVTFTLWVAVQPYHGASVAVISSLAILITAGLQTRNFKRNVWLSDMLDEYSEAANYIDEHKSLWAFDLDPAGAGYANVTENGLRRDPFEHAGAMLALRRNLVDLNNYEAASRNFPIVYKESFDPTRIIEKLPRNGGPTDFPPLVRLSNYYNTTGRPVDYVLLWDLQAQDRTKPAIRSLEQQLSNDYTLIYCAQRIPLLLYRLRGEDRPIRDGTNCPLSSGGAIAESRP